MNRRFREGIATAIVALLWTTNPGAAGVQQGGRDFSPHGQAEYDRGYERSPGRRDTRSRPGADDRRRERQSDYRRDERPHRDHDHRRHDDARKRRPGGGVIMSQPHEHERPREQPRGYGPYGPYSPFGPYGPNVPYGPYGPPDPYGPYAPYDFHERRGR